MSYCLYILGGRGFATKDFLHIDIDVFAVKPKELEEEGKTAMLLAVET